MADKKSWRTGSFGSPWEDGLRETPVRLCCGQRHWSVACPDGKVMCCICFHRFSQEDLSVDDQGQRWDVCPGCAPQAGL
jgi:hypothetical protein